MAGEPGSPFLPLLVEAGRPAGDLGLGAFEATALGGADVLDRSGARGQPPAPFPQLRLLLAPLAPGQATAGQVGLKPGDVLPGTLMVQNRPVDQVVGTERGVWRGPDVKQGHSEECP